MMKIAVTAHGQDQNATVDSRFGRAAYFVVYDQIAGSWSYHDNTQNLETAHGAGIQAAQNLIKTGAQVLITGNVGPKAFKVLSTGGVKIYSVGNASSTVSEAIKLFNAGELPEIAAPNALEIKK